jgi:hypothetical protein
LSGPARDLLAALADASRPVVICGAGIVGEALLSLCRARGVAVDSFCDNSDKLAGTMFCGLPVRRPRELRAHVADAEILVAVAAIQDAVDRLVEAGFSRWHAAGPLLSELGPPAPARPDDAERLRLAVETCIFCHEAFLHPERLLVRSLDVVITERCTLRCADCANLMQYYSRPRDLALDEILRSVDLFAGLVDGVLEYRLLGGEALVHRQWAEVMRRLTREPTGRRVVIYSNATLLPRAEDFPALRHEKVRVSITDYGPLSRRLDDFRELLESSGVAYDIISSPEWLDCAAIEPHHRSPEAQRTIFANCCAKNIATLSSGRLYRCPYSANASRLGAVPDQPGDYVDLFALADAGASRSAIRERMRRFLRDLPSLQTCDWCNGRPLFGTTVPAVW